MNMEDRARPIKKIALRITDAKELLAAVKELQQAMTISTVAAGSAIKNHTPLTFWEANPKQYWVPAPLHRAMDLLDRLLATGAAVEVLIDGKPFDHQGMADILARAEAENIAIRCSHKDDYELFRIADPCGGFSLVEKAQARKELASRLSSVDAKELLWTATSVYAPPLRRELALRELIRRGIELSNFRVTTGPCPHPRWKATSDQYHGCACCFVQEKHDWKVAMDSRGYGHGCSKCGYFEQD
jgi:hypothetical protein